jgi:hypothetical protein
MKVRCIKQDSWLSVGREYLVLGTYGRGASFKYRLIADDGRTPALHDAELFELTSPLIPRDWVFKVYPSMEWEMAPTAWAGEGFWVAYFDGDAAAKTTFARIVSELREQEE